MKKTSTITAYFLVFILAFIIRIWFAFLDGHQALFNACDASEYIAKAKELEEFISESRDILNVESRNLFGYEFGTAVLKIESIHDRFQCLEELCKRSGPVYPLFLLSCCWISGTEFSASNLEAPIIGQCMLTSLVCCTVTFIGANLWNFRTGLTAGILAALYPGLIVNSARLLSEPFACFWLTLSMVFLCRVVQGERLKKFDSFMLGFSLGLMQLARSALVVVTSLIAVLGCSTVRFPGTIFKLIFASAGFLIPICSFISLQYLATGDPALLVDRLSNYNMFVGLNLESNGWLVYPYPNFTGMIDNSHFEIIRQKISSHPFNLLKLLADKPPRLWALPWNDFKTPIGSIDYGAQAVFHQVCLILAAIGLCLSTASRDLKNAMDRKKILLRVTLLAVFLSHLVYILFVTLPRYALTSVPILLLFASAGLWSLVELFKEAESRKRGALIIILSLLLIVSIAFNPTGLLMVAFPQSPVSVQILLALLKTLITLAFFVTLYKVSTLSSRQKSIPALQIPLMIIGLTTIPFISLPLNAYGNNYEWKETLNKQKEKEEVGLEILCPGGNSRTEYRHFILIDCRSKYTTPLSVTVNNNTLKEPLMPLMPLIQYTQSFQKEKDGKIYYDLERIIANIMSAVGGTPPDIRQWYFAKIPSNFISGNGFQKIKIKRNGFSEVELFGSYSVRKNQAIIPGLEDYSFEKAFYGVESQDGLSDIRFARRFQVLLPRTKGDLSGHAGLQNGYYNIRLLRLPNANEISSRASEVTASANDSNKVQITKFPQFGSDSFFKATVKIEVDCPKEGGLPIFLEAVARGHSQDGKELSYRSPWLPSRLYLKKGLNRFTFCFPFKPAHLGDVLDSLTVSIKAGGAARGNQFYSEKKCLPPDSVQWKNITVGISEEDDIDLASGYELF